MKAIQISLALLCLLCNFGVKGNPCELDDYKNLNESGRSVNYNGGTDKCDHEDLRGTWDSWYKVSGAAGNALASKNPPASGTCGTNLRWYLRDDHPAVSDGEVTQTVCVASDSQNNPCSNSQRNIQVVNCGAFYLYKLVELRSGCGATRLHTWRYCTNGETDDKCVSVNCPAGKLCSLTDNGHQHQCVDDNGPCSPNPCKNGGTCNTNSGSFTCSCPSGYTGDNCSTSSLQDCPGSVAMGMESGAITDGQITATSQYNADSGPSQGRLNGNKAWEAGTIDDFQFLKITFDQKYRITGIATQGRPDASQWVTKYKLKYWFNNINYVYKEPGQTLPMMFIGNTDQTTPVYHKLNRTIGVDTLRFRPVEWSGSIAMRVEIYGCHVACFYKPCTNGDICNTNATGGYTCSPPPDPCSSNPCQNGGTCNANSGSFTCTCPSEYTGDDCSTYTLEGCDIPLGMENGQITDRQLSSSSVYNRKYSAHSARLHLKESRHRKEAWIPKKLNGHQWIMIRLDNEFTRVTGVATQGRIGKDRWVTKYRLVYWGHQVRVQYYTGQGQFTPKEFVGNTDRDTVVYHDLKPSIKANFIQFRPLTWNSGIAMRVELYGCRDACLYRQCHNGGTCNSNFTTGGFTCTCLAGYNGDTCALGDPCPKWFPCQNGATCSPIWNWPHFKCSCPSRYIGYKCETKLADPCSPSPCWNAGTCSPVSNWPFFKCSCPSGYIGFNCATQIADPCLPDPCFDGGTCTAANNMIGFTCSCTTESTYNCAATPADACLPNPCENGGTCALESSNLVGFTCSCPPGYIDYNCGFPQGDPCSPDPCLNGGTCSADPSNLLGGFKCSCSLGYIGFNCGVEKANPCLDNPCKNDGACAVTDSLLGFECNCTSEYLGFNCGTLKDDKCKPNPCANDGNCTRARDNPKGFTCNCTSAYTGDICENKIVHGNWSVWSPWPNCNKPCNNGSKTRKRLCNNPEPAFGGKDCDGPAIDSEPCNLHTCPAEEINYNVKLTDEVWNNKLANPNTKDYTDLKDKIKNDVKDLYKKRKEFKVVDVKVLEFRQGSVISSFNVSYPGVDGLQIVALQEEIAGGSLGNTPADLLSITTKNVPAEAAVILESNSTTSTTIDLKWSNVTQLNSAPELLGYVIVYKEKNKKFQGDIMKSVSPTPPEAVLKELKKFTNYTIRVYAFTKNGNGVPSEAAHVRTQEDVPSEPPPNTVIKSASTSTIGVSWEPMNQAYVHGILLGYEVRYAKDDGSPQLTWKTKKRDADIHEVVLRDLEYFTRYKVVVCAKTSKGCGKEYSDIAYTYGNVPGKPPQSVTAQRLKSAETIKVTWSPVPQGHVRGLLVGYSIKYRRIETTEREVFYTGQHIATAKPTEYMISLKVQSYSIYEIQVAAFTQKGMGPYETVYGETCRCPKILYTNYWSSPPYLKVNEKDKKLEGVLSGIVAEMVHVACGICPAHGDTIIKIDTNGKGKPSAKKSVLEVLGDIDNVPQISFPIYGNKYITRYLGAYAYINLVESPGVAFIAAKRTPGTGAMNMIGAVWGCVPMIMLSICMAYVSGVIIWILDRKCNPDEFPPSFIKGVWEGFWWAFISMTTVGYGDRSPRSILGRTFGIIWTLTGLVIIGVVIGSIAASLTSVTVEHPITLYGTKVGAIHNSTEHRIGILKNARVNEEKKYRNLEEIRAALEDGEIDGALVDTYVAAEHKDELFNENIFVKEILDRPFGYGVVLSGAAANVEQRCRDYINMQITEIFHIIQNKTKTLDPAPAGEAVEQSTGLFDSQSNMFLTFMIFLCGIYGVAVLAGLSYQYLIFIPGKKKVESLKASVSELAYKDALVEELREFVRSFHSELSIRITARIKKNKQTIKEIKTSVKCAKKQPKRSADYRRNVLTNPVYAGSAGENAFDLKRKSVGSESTKGILDQAQQWHSPNPAALNIAGKAGNSSSPGSNTRRRSDSQM